MLGEQIADLRGEITGSRVLSTKGPKIEVSNKLDGKTAGIDTAWMATYWAVPKAGGVLYGQGQGIVMSKDGEVAGIRG